MSMKNKEAVSPVIGVILMVAITVLLAAVIYIWVSGFIGGGGKQCPTITSSSEVGTENYRFKIKIADSSPTRTVKGLEYYLHDENGLTVTYNGVPISGTVDIIYSNDVNGIKFQDNDGDSKVSAGDIFLIKDTIATSGYKLVLKDTASDGIALTATLS